MLAAALHRYGLPVSHAEDYTVARADSVLLTRRPNSLQGDEQ
jgi:hypothetical protein